MSTRQACSSQIQYLSKSTKINTNTETEMLTGYCSEPKPDTQSTTHRLSIHWRSTFQKSEKVLAKLKENKQATSNWKFSALFSGLIWGLICRSECLSDAWCMILRLSWYDSGEDTNSIPTGNQHHLVFKLATDASGPISKWCKWRHLAARFTIYASACHANDATCHL